MTAQPIDAGEARCLTARVQAPVIIPAPQEGWTVHKELTLQEVYASDPQRARSREVRYGGLWPEVAPVPAYRLAWVRDTGELSAVELSEPDEGQDLVEVLGVLWSQPQVEACLAGWSERCGGQRSLGWARDRVRSWAASGGGGAGQPGSRVGWGRTAGRRLRTAPGGERCAAVRPGPASGVGRGGARWRGVPAGTGAMSGHRVRSRTQVSGASPPDLGAGRGWTGVHVSPPARLGPGHP
jgi:hypothetical protein